MVVVLTLCLLGLVPVVFVHHRVAYFAAWSVVLSIYLTATLSGIANATRADQLGTNWGWQGVESGPRSRSRSVESGQGSGLSTRGGT